ncbi:MAG: AAA family ATPase [Alphaproteobacteria bacterium]|nr:AAA family ATPase [Alphaproteobacteria bacterium]
MAPTADIEGLETFSESVDRQLTPFFVGRHDEISNILSQLYQTFERHKAGRRAPAAGTTRLIQGAPGAGKSALLYQLGEMWEAAGGAAPRAVMLGTADLTAPAKLAARILQQVSQEDAVRLRRTATAGGGGGLRVMGLTISLNRSGTTGPEDAWDLLRAIEWPSPVCLMVDEIQTMSETQFNTLLDFHTGVHDLPIVPVFAGLANARDVLARNGFSRLGQGAVHTLGCLDQDDAAHSVELFLDHFGVDRSGAQEDWPVRIAEMSDGWPMHLHNTMRALAGALTPAGGRLAGVDAEVVEERAAAMRWDTYANLQSRELETARSLVSAVLKSVPAEGARKAEVVNRIEQLARPAPAAWRIPAGMSSDDFLDLMVHRGVLQPSPARRLVCPIPSFRRFLIEEGESPPLASPSPPSSDSGLPEPSPFD